MNKPHIFSLLFIGVLILAIFFRFIGLNWDQGQHLHPDERFLTMVTDTIKWPSNIREFLDASTSPLNPHNAGYSFFVYGTFPIFFTKWVAELLGLADYSNITQVGRQLSALIDTFTVILIFLIARLIQISSAEQSNVQTIKKNKKTSPLSEKLILLPKIFPLLAAYLYAAMVLPIQLSHFYAVDTYLVFFITLSFYFLVRTLLNSRTPIANAPLMGISFGLALASKITAGFFLPILFFGILFYAFKIKRIKFFLLYSLLFSFACFLTFRFAQPYIFASSNLFDLALNARVLDNWKQLKSFDDVTGGFPPAVQWITTKPIIFPLKNLLLWGLGLPLGIISVLSIMYYVLNIPFDLRKFKSNKYIIPDTLYVIRSLILVWILLLFGYQAGQFIKALRYFFPFYPFLALICAFFISDILKRFRFKMTLGVVVLLALLIYPFSFITIYTRLHSRVAASEWIYKNVPEGSFKSDEVWDDALPLSLHKDGYIHEKYTGIEFPLYWPDNKEKWTLMVQNLKKVDYIFLTSNRLYGSIMTYPKKYPVTITYYQSLFDGTLGFEKVAEFTSRPNIPIPFIRLCLTPPAVRYGIISLPSQQCPLEGISFVDDYADETFTVYDHPKVIIFKKIKDVDYEKVLDIPR